MKNPLHLEPAQALAAALAVMAIYALSSVDAAQAFADLRRVTIDAAPASHFVGSAP